MTATNTTSEAWNTGYEAAKQGEATTANPYPTGTWDAANWDAGYEAQQGGE